MSRNPGVGRRTFLRSAGLGALAGAVGGGVPLSARAFEPIALAADGRYDFDTIHDRVGTDSTKWDRQISLYGRDHVDVGMGIADMDFKPAPFLVNALTERVQRDNFGYMTVPESHYEAIIGWNKRRYGLEIDRKSIMNSPAVHPSIIATLRAFSPPGTKVIVPCPSYSGFYSDIRFVGCTPADVPLLDQATGPRMDFEGIERAIGPDTNTLILCNPQNPTGNVWSKEDLLTLGEICLRRRVVVLSDEVHCDFVNAGHKYTPFATLPNEAVVRNSVTFKSAAKTFNLAGHKIAYFFSTNPDYLAKIRAWHREEISTMGMVAQRAAYTEGDSWVEQLQPYIDGNLTFVADYVKREIPLISMVKPQGTYLAWLDVSKVVDKVGAMAMTEAENRKRGPGQSPLTPSNIMEKWFVEHAKVQINPGGSFGTDGEKRMRMNCATSRKMLELALGNLAKALKNV